ncbi:alanyl-tRNA editing protein [Dongia sedimenti]|uniref:Alanine--tRNA ligase n=1 Tax=Dongia sedimenti TaxID=3064282 RepID=A0ABU0YV40_9PROT|nr:alanyl-tRNA editing protein [Rhodospirillaceae bacterium R-7]
MESPTEALFREDAYLKSCDAVVTAIDEKGIRLDRTVFYPTGGGQPGDVGRLRAADGTVVEIRDTVKGAMPGEIVHVPAEGAATLVPGTAVTAELDWERRHRLMRMHTCLHLLSSIVSGEVTGGQVSDGKGRLDFNLPDGSPDKEKITEELNRLITEDHPTGTRWITDDEMAARPELVRTMSVKPPMGQGRVRLLEIDGVDLQPCGGTHVARTGEIGAVECVKIENKGKMNRRFNLALKVE